MSEIPRYKQQFYGDDCGLVADASGPLAKWADVSSRLQQLEEQLSAKEATRQLLEADVQQLEQEKARLEEEIKTLRSRVDTPGTSDALLPQSRVGDTSTPSPVKDEER